METGSAGAGSGSVMAFGDSTNGCGSSGAAAGSLGDGSEGSVVW